LTVPELRPATVADIESALVPIEVASQPHPWSAATFAQELSNEFSAVEVAEEHGRVVGFVVYWLVADEVHLLNVCVAPASRGRGVGRRLVERVLEVAAEHHADQVCLEVRASNNAALALYGALGFRRMGVRRRYYADNGEDAVLMAWVPNAG
jgi:ribosomal-protein-alanine N-acetyltransferase